MSVKAVLLSQERERPPEFAPFLAEPFDERLGEPLDERPEEHAQARPPEPVATRPLPDSEFFADHWYARAEELRTLADDLPSLANRAHLRKIAQLYDEIADAAERPEPEALSPPADPPPSEAAPEDEPPAPPPRDPRDEPRRAFPRRRLPSRSFAALRR